MMCCCCTLLLLTVIGQHPPDARWGAGQQSEARLLLEQVAEAYRGLAGYSDRGAVRFDAGTGVGDGPSIAVPR
jgi:hypothetical protein